MFLNLHVDQLSHGLYIQQHKYAEDLVKRHVGEFGTRSRMTTAAPEGFSQSTKDIVKPDLSNPEHLKIVKFSQQVLGGMLWLSTRSRPDLAYAVSVAMSCVTRDIDQLKTRVRHLLQYLASQPSFGLLYPFSTEKDHVHLMSFADASFSPTGGKSQAGYVIQIVSQAGPLTIHWNSTRESIVAQSSAEAELLALVDVFNSTKNFQLLFAESWMEILPHLRCDNTAVVSMMENPTWRSRHISIRGEAIREALSHNLITLTYVASSNQLADPMTKPTTLQINSKLYPMWNLVEKEQ